MENNPLVSVIVPVYNQKDFLDSCLESIKNQMYSNLEVLLIDDGSNDGSENICDRWKKKDSRFKVFHLKNGGVSYARNFGLANLSGELVCFVDPDDWIEKSMIKQMVKTLVKFKLDLAFIQYDELLSYEKKETKINAQGSQVQLFTRKDIVKLILEENKLTNHVWRGIYKSRLIKINIFPEGKNYEDMYSMLEFVEPCKRFAIINSPLYHHRLNKKAITSTWNLSNCMDYCNASSHEAELALKLYPEFKSDVTYKVIKDVLYVWNNAVRSSINGKNFQYILKRLNMLLDKYYISTAQALSIRLQIYVIRHVKNGNKICNRIIYGFAKLNSYLVRKER